MKQKFSDQKWLHYVIALSRNCPQTDTAFAVGAAIVDAKNHLLADGYSRETSLTIHAEEVVLDKIASLDIDLAPCTMYSSLEPCKQRASQLIGCSDAIIEAGIKRVVFAALEPPIFVPGHGTDKLRAAGIEIIIQSALTDDVIAAQSSVIQEKWQKML